MLACCRADTASNERELLLVFQQSPGKAESVSVVEAAGVTIGTGDRAQVERFYLSSQLVAAVQNRVRQAVTHVIPATPEEKPRQEIFGQAFRPDWPSVVSF